MHCAAAVRWKVELETLDAGYKIQYHWWGDKTLYLKNINCSVEPKKMADFTL